MVHWKPRRQSCPLSRWSCGSNPMLLEAQLQWVLHHGLTTKNHEETRTWHYMYIHAIYIYICTYRAGSKQCLLHHVCFTNNTSTNSSYSPEKGALKIRIVLHLWLTINPQFGRFGFINPKWLLFIKMEFHLDQMPPGRACSKYWGKESSICQSATIFMTVGNIIQHSHVALAYLHSNIETDCCNVTRPNLSHGFPRCFP